MRIVFTFLRNNRWRKFEFFGELCFLKYYNAKSERRQWQAAFCYNNRLSIKNTGINTYDGRASKKFQGLYEERADLEYSFIDPCRTRLLEEVTNIKASQISYNYLRTGPETDYLLGPTEYVPPEDGDKIRSLKCCFK
jgi:hypothetical protein